MPDLNELRQRIDNHKETLDDAKTQLAVQESKRETIDAELLETYGIDKPEELDAIIAKKQEGYVARINELKQKLNTIDKELTSEPDAPADL